MDKDQLNHKVTFGKYRKIFICVFLVLVVATIIFPKQGILLGSCAFVCIALYGADIFNSRRFGKFYAIDIIDDQIIEISEKNGERIIRPEDIVEIVLPVDLNLLSNGQRRENFFIIKLQDGTKITVSNIVSDFRKLLKKVKDFIEKNNVNHTTRLTGL